MPGAVSTAVRAATLIQIGEETTAGDAVDATRQLLTKAATLRMIEELEPFEGQMHGTLARVVKAPKVVRRHTEFEFASDLDFEQILLPLLSGMKGSVTPSTPGAGSARLWTFTPSLVADPLIDTYTLEWVERNLDATPDELEREAYYCFTTGMEITGGMEGVPQLRFTMAGRKPLSGTKTSGQSLPTIHHAGNIAWKVYFDDTWAALGNAAKSGAVYGFTWRFGEFVRPAYYADGRADLDFSQYQYGPRTAELTLEVVIDPTSSAFVPLEEADKIAGTPRYIRLELLGAAFAAPDASLYYTIQLDGCYYHAGDSMVERGTDRDGNPTVRLHLLSAYDSSGDVQVIVQNILTAFP